jgi:hypothetical protein
MLSISLKMIKIDRNTLELRQIVCTQYYFNVRAIVSFILWIAVLYVGKKYVN